MLFSLWAKVMIQVSCWRCFYRSATHSVLSRAVSHQRRGRPSLLTREEVALWTIWRSSGPITRETEQNCEADGQEQKAILVWGGFSHFSSIGRWCYWTDKWNLLLLEKGKVYHWDRHTVRTLSVGNLRSWVMKMQKSRSVDFPAGLYPHSKISTGRRNCILIHFSILHSSELTTWSNKKDHTTNDFIGLAAMLCWTNYTPLV